jgi:chromosome segregation protein
LSFLKKQVEKVEKAALMRIELGGFYREYLKREETYIETEKSKLNDERMSLESVLAEAEKATVGMPQSPDKSRSRYDQINNIEKDMAGLRNTKDELSRKLGRLEAMIEMSHKPAKTIGSAKNPDIMTFSALEVRTFVDDMEEFFAQVEQEENLLVIQNLIARTRKLLENTFASKLKDQTASGQIEMNQGEVTDFVSSKNIILSEIEVLNEKEKEFRESIADVRKLIATEEIEAREKDRAYLELSMQKREILSKLEMLRLKEENLGKLEFDFDLELREGSVLVGPAVIVEYKSFTHSGEVSRTGQDELKKKIERIKIRLEDAGLGGGGDVLKEYEEVSNRDQFLAKELEDLTKSIEALETLSHELKEKLDVKFREGIEKINVQFEDFFKLMFGGGNASLKVTALESKTKLLDEDEMDEEDELALRSLGDEEDEEVQYGIEINVSLPHKKVKELHALSGGERSLTSIALLFAMSQVNPPPFLILDETDAALDEANSRKYGDMLERLSKFSQLVVVTHNRETMSRASTLYGVTIGSDGASKLLSIKFDEAVAIAK